MYIGSRSTVMVVVVAMLSLSVTPCIATAKGGVLSISKKARYDQDAKVPQPVKDECGIETDLVEWVQKYAEKKDIKTQLVDNASASTPGPALDIRITRAMAPKGGATTGLKGLTIRGTLWKDGKVSKFTAKRVTTGAGGIMGTGIIGTCGMLKKCSKKLGSDIAGWLEDPKNGAHLGELMN